MAALNAEVPDDLLKQFRLACVNRDISIKDGVGRALQLWIDGKQIADCPTCHSRLEVDASGTRLAGPQPKADTIRVAPEHSELVRGFLKMYLHPDMDVFRKWIRHYIKQFESENS